MTPRGGGVAAIVAGAALGALAGALIVHRAPSGYRATAVLSGERDATPTATVAYAAGVLTGQQDPLRHATIEARNDPARLVVTDSQLVDTSSVLDTNAVLEAFAWRTAAARWQKAGTLAVGDFEANAEQWGLGPSLFVAIPAAQRRARHGAGGSAGSLAFTCAVAGCGTWARVFAHFHRGGSYVISADLRATEGRARLIVGLGADQVWSRTVSGAGWTDVVVRWRPREDEPSAEIAVSALASGSYFVDRVRVIDRTVPPGRVAHLPPVRLAVDGTPVYTSRAIGLEIGGLSGLLIAAGGFLCAFLAARVRNSDAEAEQKPHP